MKKELNLDRTNETKKNKTIKNNLKIFASAVAIFGTSTACSLGFYEASVNHEHEFCKLNYIFGLEHQAQKINDGTNSFRYEAVYIPKGVDEKEFFNEENKTFNEEVYQGYHGQNVVEFVTYNIDANLQPIVDGKTVAIRDGFVEESLVYGERVELYDNNFANGHQLIRVFKK